MWVTTIHSFFLILGIIPMGLDGALALMPSYPLQKFMASSMRSREERKKYFWHLKIPTIGLIGDSMITYPYLPHMFSLHELAPKKGKGVRVALLDTGIDLEHPHLNHPTIHSSLMMHQPAKYLIKKIKKSILLACNKKNINKNELEEIIYTLLIPTAGIDEKMQELAEFFKNYSSHEKYLSNGAYSADHTKSMAEIKHIITSEQCRFSFGHRIYNNHRCIAEFLPTLHAKTNFLAHGTHCYGLLNASWQDHVLSICPNAQVIMINITDPRGNATFDLCVKGLKKARKLQAPIVCLGLKVVAPHNPDDMLFKKFEQLLDAIPYTIAAAGNNAVPAGQSWWFIDRLAYPACYKTIAFDVGAFGYEKGRYPIASFSQYQKEYGPKIVAPGVDIVSTLPTQELCKDAYGCMHGTSMAATLIAGCIALILAEFQDTFSRTQILKVCYATTLYLHDTYDWKSKSLLGTLDIRTALFVLYVLKNLKDLFAMHSFDDLVECTNNILLQPLKKAGHDRLFLENFVGFYQQASSYIYDVSYQSVSLADAIGTIACQVRTEIMNHSSEKDRSINKKGDIFFDLSEHSKKRINDALTLG